MRGSARVSSRSANSHIRSPRNVTWAPIGMPSRSLNWAMDLRARVIDRLLPGDRGEVADRPVDQLGVAGRLADAHVDHDLDQTGICITLANSNSSCRARGDLLAVALLEPRHARSESVVVVGRSDHQISSPVPGRCVRCGCPCTPSRRAALGHLDAVVADPGDDLVAGVVLDDQLDVRRMDRRLGGDDAALGGLPGLRLRRGVLRCRLTMFTPATVTRLRSG